MSPGERYLWAAYLVVLVAVLVWVAIVALKLQRLEQELADLAERARDHRDEREEGGEAACPRPRTREGGPGETGVSPGYAGEALDG